MSDSPKRREQLLADTLQGDWAAGPAAAMAHRAAAHARQRRAVKRASVTLIAAAAIVAVFLVSNRSHPVAALPTRPSVAVVTPAAPAPVAPRGYEIISDDELIAQLKDRPLLVLPEETGAKKIVLLDQ